MADMPTIYPMRMPSIPAERRPSSIDDLLPSTYMNQPNIFTGAMKQVGSMLNQKSEDAMAADKLALQYGANIQPGQSGSLMDAMARLGRPNAYGGAMDPATNEAIQLPGQALAEPLNTMGQGAALTAYQKQEQADLLAKKQADADAIANAKLANDMLKHNDNLAQRKVADQNKADYWKNATAARLFAASHAGSNQEVKRLIAVSDQRGKALKSMEDQAKADFALYENLNKQANEIPINATPQQRQALKDQLEAVHQRMLRNDSLIAPLREAHAQSIQSLSGVAPSAPGAPAAPPAAAPTASAFVNYGQNPRSPNAAWGTVNGVAGWYEKTPAGMVLAKAQ